MLLTTDFLFRYWKNQKGALPVNFIFHEHLYLSALVGVSEERDHPDSNKELKTRKPKTKSCFFISNFIYVFHRAIKMPHQNKSNRIRDNTTQTDRQRDKKNYRVYLDVH